MAAEVETENLILVVNCSKYMTPEDLVKQILDKELPSPERTLEDITYYPWSIRNKYYCADVKFLVLKCEKLGTGWDVVKGKRINALLIIFDQTELSFEMVKKWLPYVESQNASVLLLINTKNASGVEKDVKEETQALSRRQVIEWCIKHSFEFVDVNEEIDPEDDFPDTVGIARIAQALQTTEWPSILMKETSNNQHHSTSSAGSGNSSTQLDGKADGTDETDETNVCFDSNSSATSKSECKTTEDNSSFVSELDKYGDMFDGMTDAELGDDASFEQLFSRMKFMKDKAQSLPHQERKAYAEQVKDGKSRQTSREFNACLTALTDGFTT